MARKFLTPIDMGQNAIWNYALQVLATAPSSPVTGQEYYDSTIGSARFYNGSSWVNVDATKTTGIPTSAIASFASTVQGYSLSSFSVPTGNIAMAGYTLTGLATPTAAGQAAEYSWVIGQIQSAAAGIVSKPSVQAVATSNISLSGLSAIDGYTPSNGDRILVTGQTTASQNGVYNAASGSWSRTTIDGAAPGELVPGAMWFVVNGTVNAGTQWRVSNTSAITVGTTAVTVVQYGAATSYSAGNGITISSSTISVTASTGILVSGGGVAIDTSVVARKYSTAIGDGSTTAIVITHGLGTQDVHIQVKRATTPFDVVECDMAATSTTTATLTFASAPTTGQYRVTVIG